MDHDFDPAPHRCNDFVCRRSNLCRRPSASACLTSPWNHHVRRQRIAETLRQSLRDHGIDPDGPPPPDALPIEETLKIIRDEAQRRHARKRRAQKRQARRLPAATAPRPSA
jgi:hypothetical protein